MTKPSRILQINDHSCLCNPKKWTPRSWSIASTCLIGSDGYYIFTVEDNMSCSKCKKQFKIQVRGIGRIDEVFKMTRGIHNQKRRRE